MHTIYSATDTTNSWTQTPRNPQRTCPQTEAVVTAAAGTSVLVAGVELEHATFVVTALRVVAHALGLVIILDCGVIQLQGSGSGIALSIRREVSASCAAAGLADIVRRRCNFLSCILGRTAPHINARNTCAVCMG